jgi:hypothetical protein
MNLFSFVPTLTTLVGSVAAALAIGGGVGLYYGGKLERAGALLKLQALQQKNDAIEAKWQTNLEAQNELDQEERSRMAAAYDRGIAGVLRDRAQVRLPEAAASACAGASPAQLAGPDAAAFERLGRDARAVQLDLEKARAWIETVTNEKP